MKELVSKHGLRGSWFQLEKCWRFKTIFFFSQPGVMNRQKFVLKVFLVRVQNVK